MPPNNDLRDALTRAAVERAAALTSLGDSYRPVGRQIDARAIVNGIVGLHATGGSTNHLLHLVAIARAAALDLRLEDFDALASVVPLLARIYPNGSADVNHFHVAGGMGFLIAQLLDAGLLHDIPTIAGDDLGAYRQTPFLDKDKKIGWGITTPTTLDASVLRPVAEPFRADGGFLADRALPVFEEVRCPSHQILTAGIEGRLQDLGIADRKIRRRHHVEHLPGDKGNHLFMMPGDASDAGRGVVPPLLCQEKTLIDRAI